MNKHKITLPNGKVATRNSKSRTYSHVVIAHGKFWNGSEMVPGWGALSWAGSEALANKAVSQFARYGVYDTIRVVPVD